MGEMTTDRVKVFISCSHSDSEWAERLLAHLHVADSKGLIEYWNYNNEIEFGDNFKQRIENAIKTSKIFVILVSPDFIASTFSTNFEIPLIEEATKDGALVILILVRQVALDATKGIEKYQFINNDPLSTLSPRDQEELLIKIASEINNVIIKHKEKLESISGKALASAIGGAVIGSLIPGGLLGTILGGLLGGAIGSARRKE